MVGREYMTKQDAIVLWISRVIIWVAIILSLLPTWFIIVASLSKGGAFFQSSFFPKEITFENYIELFRKKSSPSQTLPDFVMWVKNSLIVCFGVAFLQIFMTAPAAYAFSRINFVGRKNGLKTLLILQMFPTFMAMPAIYGLLAKFNLLDNLFALILVLAGGSAFNIWLLKGNMDQIPYEIDEAAIIDGAGHFLIFRKIILPLTAPMLAVMFIWSFNGVFNEFLLSSLVLQSPENATVPIGLRNFINNQFSANWPMFSAASILASLPIVIIYMALQKQIQSGLAAGAIKG
ncbi:carbohydrate ABC transporter membrane protein 2 (CUT1 family) [Caldicellulosiruptor bescii]|uniref:Binding-protein-dependent transport systems inner membrane component n=2 Tax=Caldicellulosiruptor bescii TaxID=31899 RepID=B9MP83_CALBD|nr:sugar ABC transporter permease [Caldicellulosiruptor bescii]ACM61642.1 binding-protein-dependent transport systems inner membrane component [Caldicellulosiruptor bescii DSM 6725]PBC88550.1 carbohydrate ABC transporter membrane protein 2 (CUT1 family) [Caldicellulosiruptor bescii]PBC91969.1 carbohydrate ABC transporter membrane protein 2 (CUT1 family) [Caldicellulosiruptor bescii]PBD02619.1 carbohydrate ABC transporter membrane protein 2 (CUT1 family) [Caldicellulosiruptor bescii]PBD05148.1 